MPVAGLALARLLPRRRAAAIWGTAGLYAAFVLFTYAEALMGRPFLSWLL